MDEEIPISLQSLTGVGKNILVQRRRLIQLGLMHSDDEPNIYNTTLKEQMVVLNRRASMELRKGHANG